MGIEDEGIIARIKYKEAEPGVLVGLCREFPFIIVKGKSVNDLVEQIRIHINVYLKAFPEEGMKIIEAHRKGLEEKTEELEEGWKQEEKPITVSIT